MIFLVFVLALAITAGVIPLNAWLLSIAVPALLIDPSNWGAWVLILLAVGGTAIGARFRSS